MKQMTARFAGKCVYTDLSKCGGSISKGDPIVWERGTGAWHQSCGPTGVDSAADREYMAGMNDAENVRFARMIGGEAAAIQQEIYQDPESVGSPGW
jgi:hypothetical protein